MITPADDKVSNALAEHGVPAADIRRVLQARDKFRSEVRGQSRSNEMSGESGKIMASLQEVGVQLRGYKEDTDRGLQGLQANLQGLEQKLAGLEQGGAPWAFASGPGLSIGHLAVQALGEDNSFQTAANTAQRDMKIGAFEARVNVEGGIRAALVNENGAASGGTNTTFPAQPERSGMIGPVLPPLRLLDALPSRPTSRDSVEFVQVSVTGDAGVQASEGAEKAELEFEGELETAQIVTIAGHTTASVQVLADAAGLEQLINRVLTQKTLLKLEAQIMNGSGVGQNIDGLMTQAASITPTIGTTTADIYGEVLVRMADAGFSPSLAIMNPMDWYRLLLTRKSNDDESYVFGSPTMPIPPALWNTRVVLTSTIAEGNGLVIDPAFATVLDREQVSVAASRHHKDNFTKNLVTILAELRAGLEVTNQNALRKFTFPAEASSGP